MMNGRGKSDSAIVAGKPTNKAGQPAAESVEPSAEAEGNAGQQSTRRAQDRESVTQALERIRQVARQRKKERFTSLFHHISVELLRVAFFALKRDAAPGVDGLTWQDYEADLDRKIFICGTSSGGQFQIKRKTRRDRMRAKLEEIKEEMRQRRHHSIPEQGHWLKQVVTGFYAYHAVPTNIWSLGTFRFRIIDLWRRSLRRRSQKDGTTWRRITKLANDFLPRARILHPWPQERFAVKYPRWEPSARMGPARFCAGGAQ